MQTVPQRCKKEEEVSLRDEQPGEHVGADGHVALHRAEFVTAMGCSTCRRPITRSSEALGMIERSLLQTGLSEQDLDELSDFLEFRCLPEGGMDIWMLDGYLTAIVSGPELIPPGEWLPHVWGKREGDEAAVVFESTEKAEHLPVLILRRMNEISRDFRDGAANPLFLWKEDDEQSNGTGTAASELAEPWCVGYVQGMRLRADAWEPLASQQEEDSVLLAPIYALAEATAHERILDESMSNMIAELVPRAAYEIHRYWQDLRRTPRATRQARRPGRNETCLCGSGKKYKKCCGGS
jgi:uncharacterized protein